MQRVAYVEEIPALLGEFAMSVTPQMDSTNNRRPFNHNRDPPTVFIEFATAAFR